MGTMPLIHFLLASDKPPNNKKSKRIRQQLPDALFHCTTSRREARKTFLTALLRYCSVITQYTIF